MGTIINKRHFERLAGLLEGREIRKGGKVISIQGSVVGEIGASELHAVTGITREADGDALQLLDRCGMVLICLCRHCLRSVTRSGEVAFDGPATDARSRRRGAASIGR